MSAQSQSSPSIPGMFARKSSGLVRTAGPFDILAYNINFISIGLLLTFMFLEMPSLYPGVSMYLSTLIAVAIAIPTALVYGFLSASMPRSGGDYVYVSRILGPAWGTMANWNVTIWWFFYGGVPSAFFARFGIAPMLRVLGAYTNNAGLISTAAWISTTSGTFIFGALLLIVLTVIFVVGLKRFFVVQNILFFVALISTVLVIGVWLFAAPGAFPGALNGSLGSASGHANLYAAVMSSAKSNGFGSAPFSFYNTLLPITWIYLNLGFSFSSSYIGGEVKNAKRLQLWASPAAILVVAAVVMLTIFAAEHAVGLAFIGAAGFIDWTKLGLAFTPTFSELAAYSSHSLIIAFLIMFGFLFWSYAWLPGQILNGSRNLVAYSIDGLLPRRFSDVNPRFHTPSFSLIVMCAASMISLAIYVYTPYFATLVGIFGFILTFGLTSIAALLMPFRARAIFETSPIKWRWFGVPVISIVAVLSLIMCVVMEWIYVNDPYAGLKSTSTPFFSQIPYGMVWFNVAIFLSGLLLFFGAKWIQARRGMDVELSYKEIPVE